MVLKTIRLKLKRCKSDLKWPLARSIRRLPVQCVKETLLDLLGNREAVIDW